MVGFIEFGLSIKCLFVRNSVSDTLLHAASTVFSKSCSLFTFTRHKGFYWVHDLLVKARYPSIHPMA